jgi:hypothetical protein
MQFFFIIFFLTLALIHGSDSDSIAQDNLLTLEEIKKLSVNNLLITSNCNKKFVKLYKFRLSLCEKC